MADYCYTGTTQEHALFFQYGTGEMGNPFSSTPYRAFLAIIIERRLLKHSLRRRLSVIRLI